MKNCVATHFRSTIELYVSRNNVYLLLATGLNPQGECVACDCVKGPIVSSVSVMLMSCTLFGFSITTDDLYDCTTRVSHFAYF